MAGACYILSFRGLSCILEIIKPISNVMISGSLLAAVYLRPRSNMMISDCFLVAVYLVNTTALRCLVFYQAETVPRTFLLQFSLEVQQTYTFLGAAKSIQAHQLADAYYFYFSLQ